MPSSISALELEGITKRFDDVVVLDDVSLELAPEESLVVLGPSGSGKSTLLRVVAGLESADAGRVLVGGADQEGLPAHQRDVAIVFQHFALYPHLSALDNITLGLIHGLRLNRREALSRARDVAARLEISGLLDRRPRAMSGGQRQRVALARALARRAGVVLLDEPLSGLDAQLRLTLRAEIAATLRATGATVVHVTHDQNDAMAMADRIAVIRDGRLEQVDTPNELYRRPASLFVAGFVGSPPMNLIEATAAHGRCRTPFGEEPVGDRSALTFGLRPEQLELGGARAPWSANAVVDLIEPEGPSTIVHLDVGGVPMRARVHPDRRVTAGDRVVVGTDPKQVLLFDSVDGHALGSAADAIQEAERDTAIAAAG